MTSLEVKTPRQVPSSYRGLAKLAVQVWAVELESAMAGKQKHPLHRVRELHLANLPQKQPAARRPVRLSTAKGEQVVHIASITARGTATRAAGGSSPPINLNHHTTEQFHAIMRDVALVDVRYWQVLLAWGLGWSLDDQAKARKSSKSTISRHFEGGLAIVQYCLLAEIHR